MKKPNIHEPNEEVKDQDTFDLETKAEKLKNLVEKERNILRLEGYILDFLDNCFNKISMRIMQNDFRNCIYMAKMSERLIVECAKNMITFSSKDKQYTSEQIVDVFKPFDEAVPAQKAKVVLEKYLQYETIKALTNTDSESFIEKIMIYLTILLNNKAVVYFKREKNVLSLQNLLKIIESRIKNLISITSVLQLALLYFNTSIVLYKLNKLDDSLSFINYSTLILEEIDGVLQNEEKFKYFIAISLDHMHLIISLARAELKLPPMEEIHLTSGRSKFVYVLAQQYLFLACVLKANQKVKESEHAHRQSQMLVAQIKKMNLADGKKKDTLTSKQLESRFGGSNFKGPKDVDNVSHFSWATEKTNNSNASVLSNITKEQILFKQYAEISGTRFKVIIVNMQEFECIMIMLYSQPRKFLKKIYVDFQTLVDFANLVEPGSLEGERGIYNSLKKLALQISLRKGELFLRETKFYTNIEDLPINKRQLGTTNKTSLSQNMNLPKPSIAGKPK